MTKPDALERLREAMTIPILIDAMDAVTLCIEVLEERNKNIPWEGMATAPEYHSLNVAKYELQRAVKDLRSAM